MNISFSQIPVDSRVPGSRIEFDSSRATNGIGQPVNRVLLVGQMTAAATQDALAPVQVTQADQASVLFGRGSMLARMVAAFKAADRYSDLTCIGLDDAVGSVAATSTIVVSGPATASGSIFLMVGGQPVIAPVKSGDASDLVAQRIAVAANQLLDAPVVASFEDSTVTFTARNKGTCGNEIDVRVNHYQGQATPAGIALAITAFAGGATDPDYATIWPVIGDGNYRTIAIGTATTTTIGAMQAELDDRWGPERMLESFCYAAKPGTVAALAAFGDNEDTELVSTIGTGKAASPPWEWAASYAGIAGFYTAIDPARPLQTLELPGLVGPREQDEFTRAERELLLKDGIATYTVGAGGEVRIERAITMYQTNNFGIEDIAYLDLNSVTTLGFLRQSVRSRIALKFSRHKLADDGTNFAPGQAIVTPNTIRAELIALARQWEEAGLVEDLDQYVADLLVERDGEDPNRVNALIPPNLVNQFRSFAAAIQFRL